MSLTWKDAVATVIAAGVVAITYAKIKGFDWPLITSWRRGILVLLALGFASCILVGSGVVPTKSAWTVLASVLGVAALVLATIGLITGNKLLFVTLAADILALWLVSTLHHLIDSGA